MPIIHPWYQLGYIIPHLTVDMDAYQFYRIAPEGMMLITPCLDLQTGNGSLGPKHRNVTARSKIDKNRVLLAFGLIIFL